MIIFLFFNDLWDFMKKNYKKYTKSPATFFDFEN